MVLYPETEYEPAGQAFTHRNGRDPRRSRDSLGFRMGGARRGLTTSVRY